MRLSHVSHIWKVGSPHLTKQLQEHHVKRVWRCTLTYKGRADLTFTLYIFLFLLIVSTLRRSGPKMWICWRVFQPQSKPSFKTRTPPDAGRSPSAWPTPGTCGRLATGVQTRGWREGAWHSAPTRKSGPSDNKHGLRLVSDENRSKADGEVFLRPQPLPAASGTLSPASGWHAPAASSDPSHASPCFSPCGTQVCSFPLEGNRAP